MWKYSSLNVDCDYENNFFGGYPDIILHDCIIKGIRIENQNIIFEFDEFGFWISKNHKDNPFDEILRTGLSELKLINVDFDFFSVYTDSKLPLVKGTLTRIKKNITLDEFIFKLNKGEWKFEFVDEYYAYKSAMFCGYIKQNKKNYSTYAQIEARYDSSEYFWNEIYRERTW